MAHDVNPLLPYLDQVIYLAGTRALQGAVQDVITGPNLSDLYGVEIEVLRARTVVWWSSASQRRLTFTVTGTT